MAAARSKRRIYVAFVSALMSTSALLACNLINGSHERIVDTTDGASTKDRQVGDTGGPIGDNENDPIDTPDADASVPPIEAGPDVFVVTLGTSWTSPNGASWEVDGGTFISNYIASGSHAIIVPLPQPTLPSEDYTVLATVRCPPGSQTQAEFGILTRVQTNGSAVIVSSKWGQDDTPLAPFMGNFTPTGSWNPTREANGPDAGFVPNGRYRFELVAKKAQVSGRMWRDGDPVPPMMQVISPWATGKGTGFYTYGVNGAVLETLQVLVP